MFVEAKLGEDSIEAGGRGFGHRGIVKQGVESKVRRMTVERGIYS
jgi:hypothetical protein